MRLCVVFRVSFRLQVSTKYTDNRINRTCIALTFGRETKVFEIRSLSLSYTQIHTQESTNTEKNKSFTVTPIV